MESSKTNHCKATEPQPQPSSALRPVRSKGVVTGAGRRGSEAAPAPRHHMSLATLCRGREHLSERDMCSPPTVYSRSSTPATAMTDCSPALVGPTSPCSPYFDDAA